MDCDGFSPSAETKNYNERHSQYHGSQESLQEIEIPVIENFTVSADQHFQLQNIQSSSINQGDSHDMLLPGSHLRVPNFDDISYSRNQTVSINSKSRDVFCYEETSIKQPHINVTDKINMKGSKNKFVKNAIPLTESIGIVQSCCNVVTKNDDKYICGACKMIFKTACQLLCHLKLTHSAKKYVFETSIDTVFPIVDTECRYTQTNFTELMNCDREQIIEESESCEYNVRDVDYTNSTVKTDKLIDDSNTPNQHSAYSSIELSEDQTMKGARNESRHSNVNTCNSEGYSVENVANEPNMHEDTDSLDIEKDGNSENSEDMVVGQYSEILVNTADSYVKTVIKEKLDGTESVTHIRNVTRRNKQRSAKNKSSSRSVKSHQRGKCSRTEEAESVSPYHCGQCNTSYTSMSRLRYHKMKVHTKSCDATSRQCKWCGQTMNGLSSYLAHTRQCDKNENLMCLICDKTFTSKSEITEHLLSHKNTKKLICKICQKSFEGEISLHNHLRQHNQRKRVQCEHCGKAFVYQYLLTRHLTYCNKDPDIGCDQCDMKFKTASALQLHKAVHSDDRPFMCHICGYSGKKAFYLKRHIRSHTGDRPYSCKDCGVRFAALSGLNRHKKVHNPTDKPHTCTYCEKSFTTNWNLKTHLRQHTGDSPYQCDLCGKAFKQNVLLKLHLKAHYP